MDKCRSHREAAIDIGFLYGDPAEIVEAWQADMIDDKVELRKISRRVVDISDIESIAVQGQDRRALMDMDVLYTK